MDKVNIEMSQANVINKTSIFVYSIQGQLILQQFISQEKTELDISKLVKGVYIIKISNNNSSEITRLVKN
jgi:hypothetical protein